MFIHSGDNRDRSQKLSENARTVNCGWVEMKQPNFTVNGPKFIKSFASPWKGLQPLKPFPLVDILIRPGDIRYQM